VTQAIVYIRFSTSKQEHGDSRERQTLAAQEFCARHGLEILEYAEDLGVSAYKGDHLHSGALGKLSQRIMAGDIPQGTTIVVEQLDRLSRQGHRKALRWLEDVCERGLRVGVVVGDKFYDEQSLRDNMLDTIEILMKAKLAHDESLHKGRRVGEAWTRKIQAAQDGVVLTRGCPGWLEPTDHLAGDQGTSFIVNEERAKVIRRIFEECAQGTGIQTIARKLTSEGLESWGRSGNGWTPTHLRRIIQGPSAEGDFIPYENNRTKANGERVVGYYPRVVDADLVARARAGLEARKGTGGRHRNLFSNLFQGLFVCKTCRGKMTLARGGMTKDRTRAGPGYIRCVNHSLGREGCSNKAMFRYADFESTALEAMLDLALTDRFFQKPGDAAAANLAVANAAKRTSDIEASRSKLIQAVERVEDPTALLARYDELGRELADAETALRNAEKALVQARGATSSGEHLARVVSVYDAMQSDDDEERQAARQKVQEAIRGVVDMVICDPEDRYRAPEGEKSLTLVMMGGLLAYKMDNRGSILAVSDTPLVQALQGDAQMLDGALSGATRTRANSAEFLERSRAVGRKRGGRIARA
jgi:DNA invertase Pin-like site-specific DNA recombinase